MAEVIGQRGVRLVSVNIQAFMQGPPAPMEAGKIVVRVSANGMFELAPKQGHTNPGAL